MNRLLTTLILACSTFILSGCFGTVQYRDRYVTMTPNDSLLRDYDVSAPPITSAQYGQLTPSDKESLWVQYTSDLLETIGKHMSDKAGLRKFKSETEKQVEELNKKAAK